MSRRQTSDVLTMETKPKKREITRLEKLANGSVRAIYKGEDDRPPVDEVRLRELEHRIERTTKVVEKFLERLSNKKCCSESKPHLPVAV